MNKNVIGVEISGIRKFYNEVVKFPEAISLTLGQPDFPVPEKVSRLSPANKISIKIILLIVIHVAASKNSILYLPQFTLLIL